MTDRQDHWQELRKDADNASYSRLLGLRVLALGAGYSRVALTLDPAWTGCFGGPSNGAIIALADQAFATATNTLDPRYHYVAIQFAITYLDPPQPGEALTAEGHVLSLREGHGTADMAVYGADGRVVAKASGAVLAIPR